ncbi:MAG: phosphohydrolase [Bacillus thermozeamaize]|uniref:Phosphohydrolase n=1 Tax=Bacillus thermozeamaize TaxID=230954 RepID=A0A1Y3PQZ5_9BACI|nr:MAG: phosphohydrolase [Bacillus thermozeamaize]
MAKFRDPVHNFISFEKKADRLLLDLIHTREFQRLRHIRQLGLSMFTYPGAEHSRFTHSLGVAHLMKRFLHHLMDGERTSPQWIAELREHQEVAEAAALIHDIGHGPFSHALERLTKERHEQWTIRILLGNTEVRQVLEGHRRGLAQEVAEVIRRTHPSRLVVKLLSSQLDVDRTDYLLRDSLMTGAKYGMFDLEWLIHTLRIGVVNDQPEVGLDLKKGISVAEDFVMARYYMYLHVYLHKTTRSADLMMDKIFERAIELQQEDPAFRMPEELHRLLYHREGEEGLANYLRLTDHTIWHTVYQWSDSSDPILSTLCTNLLKRRLYKAIDLEQVDPLVLMDVMGEVAEGADWPLKYLFLEDEDSSSPYTDSYLLEEGASGETGGQEEPGEEEASENIYLFDEQGRAHELSRTSPLIRAIRNQRTALKRLYVPEEVRERILQAMAARS